MKIMSVNTGSSSLKFALYDFDRKDVIATGLFERIGNEGSGYSVKFGGEKYNETAEIPDHSAAVSILMDKLISLGIVESLNGIEGIGHRVVQGIHKFNKSVIITEDVIREIEGLQKFAPLHNPPAVKGIRAFREAFMGVPMVAVFDTAFHQTMESESYLYPVPLSWYQEHAVRKYGFHGINHQYVANVIQHFKQTARFNMISCHIGSGASACAIKNMRCVDTSMGFTPLAGLMMGSRSGDIDPSIIPYIMEAEGKTAEEVIWELNQNSGLYGISGASDMRDILELCEEGDQHALLVRRMFVRRIVNYIAQYFVLLGGADTIVFTGGIGENSPDIRWEICEKLECLGLLLDPIKNETRGELASISTRHSKMTAYVIPANEELMIALDVYRIVDGNNDDVTGRLLDGWM